MIKYALDTDIVSYYLKGNIKLIGGASVPATAFS